MIKILLVEDEAELAHWLAKALARNEDFVVDWSADGLLADRRLQQEEFDVVVLDLGLPGMDGATVLARMRARDDRTPVIVLTARDSLTQRVGMLHEGADDFLPKPFQLEELEARLQALVRRSRGRQFERMACADLLYDLSSQRFSVAGEQLALTPREHAVMRVLIQKSGEPVAKQAILDRILSEDSDLGLDAVEVIVHRLRKKLQTSQAHIITMRGLGYCLEPNLEAAGVIGHLHAMRQALKTRWQAMSLKARLLTWIVPIILIGSTIDIWSSAALLRHQAQEAYDRALAGVVRVIDLNISTESGGLALAQPYQLLEMFELTATGNVFYRVATEDGLADIGFATMPTPEVLPPSGVLHFYDATYVDGERARVAMLVRPLDPPLIIAGERQRVIVQVAESLSERDRYTAQMVWRSVGRDGTVLVLLVAAVLLGVWVAFRPLQRLQSDMEMRDQDDLRPISRQDIPDEVAPLVDAINRHIARFTQHVQLQRQFLDDASHQLRTPLTTLRTSVDYALRESDPQELKAALQAMRSGLDRAERVTNQMLALAKVQDASMTAPEQALDHFDLGQMLEDCVRLMLPAARAKRLDYGLDLPEHKVRMRGMRLLIQEAILNVLDNAIKYTPAKGTVLARLELRQGQVCVIVEDSGPGMSEIDIQQAGVRFRRGAAGKANNGAGLGLAIVDAIVTTHQGEMRLISPVGTNGLQVELVFFLGLNNGICKVLG